MQRPALVGLVDHWGLVLAYGLVTLGLGIALAVWPDASVTVFTVLLAIQLIVAGIFRIGAALSVSRSDGGVRALVGLSGGLALIVGLLILRDPLQTRARARHDPRRLLGDRRSHRHPRRR